MANGGRIPGGFGVRRPDRSVRMQPGSFNMDPGMRAPDEFTDVTSAGYREQAKRVAERGGAKQYATSVEEEEADTEADELREQLLFVLAALFGGGVAGMGANRALGPGARPGLGLGSRNLGGPQGLVPGPTSARVGGTGGGFTAGIPGSPTALPPLSRPPMNIPPIDYSKLIKPRFRHLYPPG